MKVRSARYPAMLTFNWARSCVSYAAGRTDYFSPLPVMVGAGAVRSRRSGRALRFRLRPGADVKTFIHIFQREDYRLDEFARFEELNEAYRKIVGSGAQPLIVDCGANNGMSVAYFADAWPGSKVVAIEPDPENLAMLRANTAGWDVDYVRAGVAGRHGRLRIDNPQDGTNAYTVRPDDCGDIEAITINQVLAQYDCSRYRPFIVKIDIEGSEADVFAGDASWIDAFPLMIVELHDWMLPGEANSSTFLRAVAARARDFVYRGENVYSFRNPM